MNTDHVKETRDALSRNVAVQTAAKIGYLVTRFMIPPFVLAHVGLEAYGVWATVFVLVSYLGVSTFGIANVYVKYVAEYSARGDYSRANGILSTGVIMTTTVSAAMFAVVYLLWPQIADFMNIEGSLRDEARSVVLMVVGVFLTSIALSVFNTTLKGRQRIAGAQGIWVVAYLVETALIFLLVGMGRGIQGLAEAYLVRTILEIGLAMFLVYRDEKWFSLSPRWVDRQSLRTIVRFGGTVQLIGLLAIALNSMERLLAVSLIGVKAAGLADIGKKLPGMASTIPSSFSAAFIPAASYLQGGLENDPDRDRRIHQLYLKGARYMNLSAAFLCGFLATLPQPILDAWLGEFYPGAAVIMVMFAISTQVHLMTGPGTSILKGLGRPQDEFFYLLPNFLLLAMAVPLSRLLAGEWNLVALVAAVTGSTVLAAAGFVRHANRVLGVTTREYLVRVAAPGILPYGAGFIVALAATPLAAGLDRLETAMLVAVAGVVYGLILLPLTLFVALDRGERQWFAALAANAVRRLGGRERGA